MPKNNSGAACLCIPELAHLLKEYQKLTEPWRFGKSQLGLQVAATCPPQALADGLWAGCPKYLGLDMLAQWGGWPYIWICWNGQAPDKVSALEDVLVHGAPFLTHSSPESTLRLTAISNLGNHRANVSATTDQDIASQWSSWSEVDLLSPVFLLPTLPQAPPPPWSESTVK